MRNQAFILTPFLFVNYIIFLVFTLYLINHNIVIVILTYIV